MTKARKENALIRHQTLSLVLIFLLLSVVADAPADSEDGDIGNDLILSTHIRDSSTDRGSVISGDVFILDLKVENAADLGGVQLSVSYNPVVLSVLEVQEGDFLKRGDRLYS